MNLIPAFSMWQFAVAGAIFASGPLIIHLLNRRRFRVVQWAAMDFLLQAVKRNRRMLQLRDLILLLLRTAAVLLFGLALAQPFLSKGDADFNGTQPLHAVLVIDNSLSTGYQHLEGNLLDRTRQEARRFIDRLPEGSLVSLIPLAGSSRDANVDPYASREHALAALERIEVVDRAVSFQRAVNEAKRASEAAPNLAKRVVFFTDQQRAVWNDLENVATDTEMPAMQIVNVAPDNVRENTWIASLRVQDGLADVETPTTILVEVEHQGEAPRSDVLVTLFVDDMEVAAKAVSVEPGPGRREIAFEHIFRGHHPEPGRPAFVPIRATLTPDRLPADDQRHLVVPVVTSLPVVFVDQFNQETEDVSVNRIGETRHLRKLLAPSFGARQDQSHLIRVRHRTIEQLDRDLLADTRLVVVAGIADPGTKVGLLREYVQQGGQLVIAAGGQFNPAAWTSAAWQEGDGVLPVPLLNQPLGSLPDQAGQQLKPFFLATESLESHPYFRLAGISEDELRDLYSEPFFFQAVIADVSDELIERLRVAEMDRLRTRFPHREKGQPATSDEAAVAAETNPPWLLWESPTSPLDQEPLPADVDGYQRWLEMTASAGLPRVIARFTDPDHTAYLVERSMGRGHVVFASSGLLSNWNTIAQTNAMVLFDRLLRSMIESTLPQRNFESPQQIGLPLVKNDRDIAVSLTRPGGEQFPQPLDVGFLRRDTLGVTVDHPLQRGLYRVVARKRDEATGRAADDADWELAVTVNGPASESDLRPLTQTQQAELAEHPRLTVLSVGEPISLAGAQTSGQDSWWWLIVAVLLLLACEIAMLTWPVLFARPAPDATSTTSPSLTSTS